MSAPDFANVIAAAISLPTVPGNFDPIRAHIDWRDNADDVLAAKVLGLPGCPTIAHLLAIGAAVMNGHNPTHEGPDGHLHGCTCGRRAVEALRSVQP